MKLKERAGPLKGLALFFSAEESTSKSVTPGLTFLRFFTALLRRWTMSLVQQREPFDDWNWSYEIKHDGFRALAVIEHGQCRFFSKKKHK
ncbi:MAG TPA: hypothetical protein VFM05_14625, partial [Candidatus Saccharimonadales bacterium]|nr:hypothetical protein [Candidatus Saccharimonadales bacterium]